MKKIISLLATVAMLATMSVTAFASNAAPFSMSVDKANIELAAEGTETVNVTTTIEFESDVAVSAINITFDTDGLAIESIDSKELEAYLPLSTGACTETSITLMDEVNFTTPTIPANTPIDVVAKVIVDKTVAKTYNITLTTDTSFLGDDFSTSINDCATYPTATITVAEAAPSKTDVVIAAPAVQKSEEANGVYNAGFLADFTVDADANNAVKAVKFTVNNGSDNAETTVELGTTVEAGTVKVALNILNVTAGVELTTTVAPIAE